MEGVDHLDTFIAVAQVCPATAGMAPPLTVSPSVAARTSGDVIFPGYADRLGVPEPERAASRKAFYGEGSGLPARLGPGKAAAANLSGEPHVRPVADVYPV